MKFYLGTHEPAWLKRTDVPLFVSHRRLARRKTLLRARGAWALDSGGFTEIAQHGCWRTSAQVYATAVRQYHDEIGGLEWAAPQDWMCEPHMIERTGLSVIEHQRRTVASVCELRALDSLPFIPVLQGWELADYLRCVDLYDAAGIDLRSEPRVGIGSVCRRQSTAEIGNICSTVAGLGIKLHGFGVKALGLRAYGQYLRSSDSMAWSYNARCNPPLPGHGHPHCNNCMEWALGWRQRLIERTTVG